MKKERVEKERYHLILEKEKTEERENKKKIIVLQCHPRAEPGVVERGQLLPLTPLKLS